MTLLRMLWPLLAAMAMSAPADAASHNVDNLAGQLKAAATFCDGTYALCIKAACAPIASRSSGGGNAIDSALCSCEVVKSWSMGPASCAARMPVQQGGYTYLISTYSNLFNATNKTLTCSSTETLWAWCYGAPCVVDSKDPNKGELHLPGEAERGQHAGRRLPAELLRQHLVGGDATGRRRRQRHLRRLHEEKQSDRAKPAAGRGLPGAIGARRALGETVDRARRPFDA
jgi:hypothetical protein